MRILMYAPICRMNNKAVEGFLEQHYNKDNVLIYYMLEDCAFMPRINPENMYSSESMRLHRFEKISGFEKVIPLDSDFLSTMSRYEGEVYKMMDIYFPKVKSFDDRQRLYFQAVKLLNSIIVSHHIDVYIMYGIPHQVWDFIIYAICRTRSIPVIMIYRSMIVGYSYYFYDMEDHFHGIKIRRKASIEELNSEFQNNYFLYRNSSNGVRPYYMPERTINGKINVLVNRINSFIKYEKFFCNIFEVIQLIAKKWEIDCLIQKLSVEPDYTKQYIYFGLHYQPEGTTSPCAGYFANQQLAIHILSESVPQDVYIYVKEHPSQGILGEKGIAFFTEISSMRNVVIVPTSTSSHELTKKSIAVATCTGTVAYEAMYQNKAALLFGFYIYNNLPNAFTIKSVADCMEAIKIIQNGINITDEEILGYLSSLQSICYHCEVTMGMADFMKNQGINDQDNNKVNKLMLEDALIGLKL